MQTTYNESQQLSILRAAMGILDLETPKVTLIHQARESNRPLLDMLGCFFILKYHRFLSQSRQIQFSFARLQTSLSTSCCCASPMQSG